MTLGRPVRILVTGGTTDKVHDPRLEALVLSRDGATLTPEILADGAVIFQPVRSCC